MEALRSLIPDPRFRKRIEDGDIDYLAVLGGETRTSETKGGIGCGGGYGGGACVGALRWDHQSHLSALVVDLRRGLERSKEPSDSTGTSWFAMLAIVPVGAPSTIGIQECEKFGYAVIQALVEMKVKGM
jgi:hypothetical protein